MNNLLTMIYREWLEWHKAVYIVLGVFVALLLLGTYSSYRISQQIDRNEFYIDIFSEEEQEGFSGDQEKVDWGEDQTVDSKSLKEEMQRSPRKVLGIWAHLLRGVIVMINLLIIGVAVFYLADALYKERADGSTFYYRSLPVSDITLLSSKVLFGYVGVLLLSYVLSLIFVLYSPVLVPGVIKEILAEAGLSVHQFKIGDLLFDWAVFHLVMLFWLFPLAMYFLFISSVVKNRPLLIGVGILVAAAILWQIIFGKIGIPNQITVNLGILNTILQEQWANVPVNPAPGGRFELFDSFAGYLFTVRTLVSLVISAGFGYGTYMMYTRNIEVT